MLKFPELKSIVIRPADSDMFPLNFDLLIVELLLIADSLVK